MANENMPTIPPMTANAAGMIMKILTLTPIIYSLMLLFMSSTVDPSTVKNTFPPMEILIPIFAIVSLVDIYLVFNYFLRKAREEETVETAFPMYLLAIVLFETIGILGFLLGLWQLYVVYGSIQWNITGSFLLVSFLLMYHFTFNIAIPELRKLQYENRVNKF